MADEKRKKERKKEKRQNGNCCSGISRLHKRLGKLRGYLCNTQVKLICLYKSLGLYFASHFVCVLPIPYVQATILNLLNPYIRSCYRNPWLHLVLVEINIPWTLQLLKFSGITVSGIVKMCGTKGGVAGTKIYRTQKWISQYSNIGIMVSHACTCKVHDLYTAKEMFVLKGIANC